ncbi:MAG: hypothetical protein EXR58_07565 [Chloroflexi bacterium]|nr:hypothetical protein [Chloroflexota bacterium]
MESTGNNKTAPFLNVEAWGREFFSPPLGRAQSYVQARRLGLLIQISERRVVVSRRAAEALADAAIERVRADGAGRKTHD